MVTKRANTFGKRGGGGRRADDRIAAPLPAYVISLSTRHRALLANISATGARVRVEDPPKRGSEVFLMVNGLDLFGRIIWKSGEHCGIRFDDRVEPFALELMRRKADAAAAVRMTAAQEGGADDWATGVAR